MGPSGVSSGGGVAMVLLLTTRHLVYAPAPEPPTSSAARRHGGGSGGGVFASADDAVVPLLECAHDASSLPTAWSVPLTCVLTAEVVASARGSEQARDRSTPRH